MSDEDFSLDTDRAARSRDVAREYDTRLSEARYEEYLPPSVLPIPKPIPGIDFRWVRVETLGIADKPNVSMRFREGWEPVRAEDHPELMVLPTKGGQFMESTFKGTVEIAGLILCKMPSERAASRTRHYATVARRQMEAVDHDFMRQQQDKRMPLFRDKHTVTQFGTGSGSG
ncbi:MAG TPA: hypothetical protein VMX15_04440 [Candidatus Heimdallarchaeota archaeon]|nr:hypothetical protein [Candidatus Heimdallarchaeota archaeon]